MSIEQKLRRMEFDDIDSVFQIDQQEYGSHWAREQFHSWVNGQAESYVLEQSGKMLGFFILKTSGDEAELLHIGMAREEQGKGLGKYLFKRLLELMQPASVKHLFLEVRASNHKAIRLYQSFGAKQIGIRKNYYTYFCPAEDALVFVIPV